MPARTARTRRIALAITVLSAVIGLAPIQSATADTTPAPTVTVTAPHAIDMYGPAQELDVTIASPPTADAYVRLEFAGTPAGLHVTDDSGTELPLGPATGNWGIQHYTEVTVGAQDSDGNGVPGTPLPADTIRLHVRAEYPLFQMVWVTGVLVDGATGTELTVSRPSTILYIKGPRVEVVPHTTVTTGQSRPALADFHTEMWSAGTTPVPVTHTRVTFAPEQIAAAGYTADQVVSNVSMSTAIGLDATTLTPLAWSRDPDGSLSVDMPAIDWTTLKNNANQLDQMLGAKAPWGFPAGKLIGSLQVLDTQGRPYDSGSVELDFDADYRPPARLAAFYARDASGELYQYRGAQYVSGPTWYDRRRNVGPGWNTYTALTALSDFRNNGAGDMIGRDHDGVLWYYAGTVNITRPFGARTRVGGGWNTYTLITGANDVTGDGHPDLIARDSAGVLWLYKGTGKATAPFAARTRIGAGWNTYNLLTQAGDMTGDGHNDLLARDTAGRLWLYRGTGNAAAPYAARIQVGSGWQGYTHILGVGDMTVDGHPDVIATDKAGQLWYYAGTGNTTTPYKPRVATGPGWNIYNALL
ncbi:FG-GAP repeat domain-containing protein [Streptomyces sp. NPDC020917]|uniref:FG-GAP repeat domain-containing protein n=1 Tax=Streptomyces sp. NPDC020917 TaxID=3365102 RepID=UPI0037AE4A90